MIALAAALHLLAGQVMVLDEGNRLGRKLNLNFAGAGVTCVSNGASQATCTISGGGAGGAPTTATYWTGSADATLSAEYNLGALATGLVLNTAGVPSAYGGTGAAPANQWLKSLSASGVGTWAQVDWADLSGKPATFTATTPVATATALAANPANCSAGQAPLGVDASGAVEGCFTPAGTYTLPAASTTLGGVKMASACGAGNHVSSIGAGGELTCSADAGGGGGSPGGSSGQVQYNNAGAFGGGSEVELDGTNLVLVGRTTEPAAPAAGRLKLWAMQPHGSGAPVLPYWKGGTTQVDYRLFPEVLSTDPVWGCLQPAAHGSTTITASGSMQAGGATGTAAAVAWASTDARTRAKWVQYPTTAAINLNAGYRANTDYVWRGSAAGLGGFYVWGSMTIVTGNAGQRVFMGLKDATAVLTAASDPNAALDTVYFGANAADTNLSICSNDNASTATCTTLGASFPAKTANQAYDVAFWAAPNGSSIGYAITNVVSGANATGTVSTDLPRNTVQLGFDFNINSGTGAVITTMQFGGTCYIANP